MNVPNKYEHGGVGNAERLPIRLFIFDKCYTINVRFQLNCIYRIDLEIIELGKVVALSLSIFRANYDCCCSERVKINKQHVMRCMIFILNAIVRVRLGFRYRHFENHT